MIDLIDRQAAIDAVSYAMKNGGDWRPALEAVPTWPPEAKVLRVHVRAHEWIPIEEEVPPAKHVLVTIRHSKYDYEVVEMDYWAQKSDENEGRDHRCLTEKVIAWMSIPDPYEKEDTQPPQPETYTHDAAWWKEHHDMGFESPIYDLFKALGVYDDEEDDPNGQL